MIIGTNNGVAGLEFFELLLRRTLETDAEVKREITNSILECFPPLISQVIYRFHVTDKEDLFQHCWYKLLLSLDKWEPTKVSAVEGFFRLVCENSARDYVGKRNEREFRSLISYDTEESEYLMETYGVVEEDAPFKDFLSGEEVFADLYLNPVYNSIYQECISFLLEEVANGESLSYIVNLLMKAYPTTTKWRINSILQNAKITLREHLLYKLPVEDFNLETQLELADSALFKRLATYLTSDQLNTVLLLFGGCLIKVPKIRELENGKE